MTLVGWTATRSSHTAGCTRPAAESGAKPPRGSPRCTAAAALMAENQGIGTGAVQQPEGHGGVPGMVDASLPFHQHDVGILARLQHQPLGRAGDEVGDHGIHRDPPALDHDAGLTGGNESGPQARRVELPGELELRRHLSDVAVGAHREDHVGIDRLGCARTRSADRRAAAADRRSAGRPPWPWPRAVGRRPERCAARSTGRSPRRAPRPASARHSSGSRPPAGRCRSVRRRARVPVPPASIPPPESPRRTRGRPGRSSRPGCRSSTATVRSGR